MSELAITVAALSAAPVKGLRVAAQPSLRLERDRIAGDRAFYLVDAGGRMINGKRTAGLQSMSAEYEEQEPRLTLTFPDGRRVSGPVELGQSLRTRFYSLEREARIVRGPFAEPISAQLGFAVRLVAPVDGGAADRGAQGAVSVISRASLARLAELAGVDVVDARRFRMSIELAGSGEHEEDQWVGGELTIGQARVAVGGHVGRCIVTTRDPDGEAVDLPTLDLLRSYRGGLATSEPLAFGVYGAVIEPGTVRIGDTVVVQRVAKGQ